MKKTRIVVGEYNHYGYTIFEGEGLNEFYSASNHSQDSSFTAPLNDPSCLPLKEIRKYCIKTGKEIAKEKGMKWKGATRIEDQDYL